MRRSTLLRSTRATAFTLVELLVVIGIIAVLISVLLPALSGTRQQARTVQCAAAMREVGQAMSIFANQHRNRFPSVGYETNPTDPTKTVTDPWQFVLNQVVYKRDSAENAPIQRMNYVGSGGNSINAGYGPGAKRLVCPETGKEGATTRYWTMNVYAAGGIDFSTPRPFLAGLQVSSPYYDRGIVLGAQTTRFRDPARKFLVLESAASGEVSLARTTSQADPSLATKQAPWSLPQKIFAFRHRGLSANVLWVDGHVSLIRHTEKINVNLRTHWSFNNEELSNPPR